MPVPCAGSAATCQLGEVHLPPRGRPAGAAGSSPASPSGVGASSGLPTCLRAQPLGKAGTGTGWASAGSEHPRGLAGISSCLNAEVGSEHNRGCVSTYTCVSGQKVIPTQAHVRRPLIFPRLVPALDRVCPWGTFIPRRVTALK